MELGSGKPFWPLDFRVWEPIIASSWLKATWHDMHLTGLFVCGPHTPIPLTQHHDAYLMDCFMAQHPSPEQFRILNEVRLFKQVTRLSDIVTADGIYLDTQSFSAATPA